MFKVCAFLLAVVFLTSEIHGDNEHEAKPICTMYDVLVKDPLTRITLPSFSSEMNVTLSLSGDTSGAVAFLSTNPNTYSSALMYGYSAKGVPFSRSWVVPAGQYYIGLGDSSTSSSENVNFCYTLDPTPIPECQNGGTFFKNNADKMKYELCKIETYGGPIKVTVSTSSNLVIQANGFVADEKPVPEGALRVSKSDGDVVFTDFVEGPNTYYVQYISMDKEDLIKYDVEY